MVSIKGFSKAEVFMALYNNAQPLDKKVTLDVAVAVVDENFFGGGKLKFASIGGKHLYVDILGDKLDDTFYNEINAGEYGFTAAYAISELIKLKKIDSIKIDKF